MTIETKFDIGDQAWWLSSNKVHSADVKGMNINIEKDKVSGKNVIKTSYKLSVDAEIYDDYLFKSKEELLKSL